MKKIITKCPKCDDTMYISEFMCPSCDTTIRGQFEIEKSDSMLGKLTDEDKYFVLVFLQTGGKIQDVERAMGISYPTVKAKLEDIQAKLKGEHKDWNSSDDFDASAFKSEMKNLKRKIKHKVMKQVRDSLKNSLGDAPKHDRSSECDFTDQNDYDIQPESTSEQELCQKDDYQKSSRARESREEMKDEIKSVIDQLESGEIDFETAMSMINKIKN